MKYGKSKNKEKVEQVLIKNVPEKHRGHMRTIGEQFIQQGIEQNKRQIVFNMLESNISTDIISTATKLSPAEIEKLKNKFN